MAEEVDVTRDSLTPTLSQREREKPDPLSQKERARVRVAPLIHESDLGTYGGIADLTQS